MTNPELDKALDTIARLDERPKRESPYNIARRIVCEEWQQAVKEFGLTPGSVTEKVVSSIIDRLDRTIWPTDA